MGYPDYGFNPAPGEQGGFGYPGQQGGGLPPWMADAGDIIGDAIDIFDDIFGGSNDVGAPPPVPPPGKQPGGSTIWDEWFGGGSYINLFGVQVPRVAIIGAAAYFLFFSKKRRR